MKISFDIDGTVTDFSNFVFSAEKYFKRKHNMSIVNPNGLEVEEVYDVKNVLISRGFTEKEAEEKTKKITDKYWVSVRFIKFSLLGRFRKGVKRTIKQLKKHGHKIEIDSSRAKSTKDDFVGKVARSFTRWQCRINGIFLSRKYITFYENDDKKIDGIKNKGIQLLFDDKPEVINEVCRFSKVICINTNYNKDIQFNKNVIRIDGFDNNEPIEAIKKLIGEKKYDIITRKAWRKERENLTAEKDRLYQDYYTLKNEVKEIEEIKKSVYEILKLEERERQPTRKHKHEMEI